METHYSQEGVRRSRNTLGFSSLDRDSVEEEEIKVIMNHHQKGQVLFVQ